MRTLNLDKLGERLRELRTAHQLTQQELAVRLKLSKQQINHLENGRSALTLEHLLKLAHLYQIGVEAVIGEEAIAAATVARVQGTPVPLYNEEELHEWVHSKSAKNPDISVYSKTRCSAAALAFHLTDRSMFPLFSPGDLVIVDSAISPSPGDCIAVLVAEAPRILFRRYRPAKESQRVEPPYTLRAENPDYEPRPITKSDQPKFLGTLIEHTRFGARG